MPRVSNIKISDPSKAKVSRKARLGAINRLLGYVFKYYPWQFALVVICILLSSSAGVIGSYFVGSVVIAEFVQPALTAHSTTLGTWNGLSFGAVIALMALVYILGVLGSFFYNFLMSIIGQGVQKRIRDELFSHMQSLPISYFDSRSHGDVMSIYTNDVDALREMLSRSLPMAVSSFVTMAVCFVMMILTDLILTGIVVIFAILIFFVTKYFAQMSSRYFISQQIELGKTNGYIEELTNGQKVVKVFNYEDRNLQGFREHNESYFHYSVKANRFASILMPTVNQLGNIQYAALALAGAIAVIQGITTGYSARGIVPFGIGTVISFLLYSKSFTQPIGQISQQLNVIALALAGATRIFEMNDAPVERDDGYVRLVNAVKDEKGQPVEVNYHTGLWAWKHPHADKSPTTYTWLRGKITLDNVDFSYVPGTEVLHGITLYAEPGQKVAFVGPTGAGKTTITNLLNRFYDIADGKIRYDDININKIKKDDLRRSLGMVLQETKLFTGTVKDNIRFGKLDATDEEVAKAAKLANADFFISHLPQGYDTVLENGGASLSQGQRQLLSIARCAIADPPVMILDEATSSIDSRTEQLVQQGMDAIMKGRTVFVIAHRLSTIQNADVIMVLENGAIIERGNHAQLLEQKGKYYQLYHGGLAEQD